jgi:hypothetical protein
MSSPSPFFATYRGIYFWSLVNVILILGLKGLKGYAAATCSSIAYIRQSQPDGKAGRLEATHSLYTRAEGERARVHGTGSSAYAYCNCTEGHAGT